jgi:hypothetical protein
LQHWTQKQVTLFPVHIVCHAADSTKDKPFIVKESLIILSDGLAHNAGAVYVFTDQLLFHLENNPTSHLLTCHFPVGVVFTSSFPLMVLNDFILVTIGNDRLQVFLCTKDYNKKQKVEALNRKVKQIAVEEVATKSTKELSDISVCRYSEFFVSSTLSCKQ